MSKPVSFHNFCGLRLDHATIRDVRCSSDRLITGSSDSMTQRFNRREFLKTASAATLATMAMGAPKLWAEASTQPEVTTAPAATADTLIILNCGMIEPQ